MSGSITSPLTLQMLMANGGAMGVPQDPAVAAALPRLQLAQSMMQSGMSTAPTEKYGALSRVAQAMLGNVMFDRANSGIQDILNQRAQQAGAANSYIMGGEQNAPGSIPGLPAPTPASASTSAPPVNTFATQLASSEGAPGSVNKQGFSGQFQFGADRLASTGLYSPAAGENTKNNEWKGTFNIPGFPDVKTQKDFLASPQAQNAALGVDIQNTDKVIANTPGAGALDQNGLRAVAHLGGVDGMRKFVESNGQYNPADANGTSLSDYYHKFSGAGAAGAPSVSSPAPGTAPAGPNPWEVIRRAGSVLTNPAFQYNQQAQVAAQHAIDIAKLQISTGSYSTTPSGTQREAYSGKEISAPTPALNYTQTAPGIYTSPGAKPEFAPTPRPYTTPGGAVGAVGPGGTNTVLAPNPSGIGGESPESQSMRIMAEVGPKIIAGTASEQERASYNTAATTYQGYKTATNPATQQLIQAPERPLPPGMPTPQAGFAPVTPNPSAPGVAGAPHMPAPGATMPPAVTPLTESARGPQTAQDVTKGQMDADAKEISAEQASVMKGHSALGATAAIRAELPNVTTGPSADARLTLSRYGTMLGIPNDDLQKMIGTDPVSGELLQKKLFEIQTHALRLMGAREPGSVLQAYQKNFPNMASQPGTADTMTRMLDMDQIFGEDEIRGRQQHFQKQVAGVAANKPYEGLGGYQQPDPRVYVSAALASGGRPMSEWAHGLTPQQQTQALQLAAKVWPDASAYNAQGVKHQFQAPQPAQGGSGG